MSDPTCSDQQVIELANGALRLCQALRILPGKRSTYLAKWQQQQVVAKLFYGKRAKAHHQREVTRYQQLSATDVATPKLLLHEVLAHPTEFSADKTFILIYEYIAAAKQPTAEDLMPTLVALHQHDFQHQDLHTANFLQNEQAIYVLDIASIKSVKHLSFKQRAQDIINLYKVRDKNNLEDIIKAYLACAKLKQAIGVEAQGQFIRIAHHLLPKLIKQQVRRYVRKTSRQCSEYKLLEVDGAKVLLKRQQQALILTYLGEIKRNSLWSSPVKREGIVSLNSKENLDVCIKKFNSKRQALAAWRQLQTEKALGTARHEALALVVPSFQHTSADKHAFIITQQREPGYNNLSTPSKALTGAHELTESQKKIGLIIPNLAGGGAERVVLTLAKHWQQQGHEVHVLLFENKLAYPIPAGVQLTYLYEQNARPWPKFLNAIKLAKRLKSKLQQLSLISSFDLLIASLPEAHRVCHLAKLSNIYYTLHNNYSHSYQRLSANKRGKRLKRFKTVYANKAITAVSAGVLEDFKQLFKIPLAASQVIYNPFEFDHIQQLANEQVQGLTQEDYIIHIGRFDKQKRHDILLQAFSLLNSPIKLVLLTKPEAELIQLIRNFQLTDKVILPGFQKNPYPWIKQAKLLVLSSDFEGFGNVIVEALALNTPVVSTDCPSGPNEILVDDLAVGLTAVGDSQALADKITALLQDPPNIQAKHYQHFSVENIAAQYLALARSEQPKGQA